VRQHLNSPSGKSLSPFCPEGRWTAAPGSPPGTRRKVPIRLRTHNAGAFPGVNFIRSYLHPQSGDLIWSPDDEGPGRASRATSHSSFDDEDTLTLDSVQYIIEHGLETASIATR
jgi:hypothetical protein